MSRELDPIVTPEGFCRLERHGCSHVAGIRVYVHKEHRRKGAATAMIRQAMAVGKQFGIRRFEATPYCDNVGSQVLFERMPEFEHEGVRRGGGMRDGHLVDTQLYACVR